MTRLNRFLLLLFIYISAFTSPTFASSTNSYLNTISLSKEELTWIKNHPEVTVGAGPDWAPFDFVSSNQQYIGIARDYLSLIEKKSGLKFKYVIDNWNNNLNKIKNQQIDLIGAAYHTKERAQFVNFSAPYFEVLDYFFIRDDIDVYSLKDLDYKRVAIPKGFAQASVIKKHFPNIKIVTVDTVGDAIDAVLEKKADMLFDAYAIISHALKKASIKTIIPFKSTRHLGINNIHIITRKNAPELISIIQKSLQLVTPYEKQKIQNKWLGLAPRTLKTALLNSAEKQWIKNHPQIIVGGLADVLPFNFVNEKNQHQGIVNDYLKLISQKTGLSFKIKIDKWSNLLDQLKQKQIDIVGGAYYTEERSQYALFSDSFFEVVDYFFIRQDIQAKTLDDLNGMRAATPKGFVHGALLKKYFPKINLVEVDSFGASIDTVLERKADLLFNSFATLKYSLKKSGVNSIIPFKSTRQKLGTNHYRMMIRGDAPILQSIINKGLSAIDEVEKESVYKKWLGAKPLQKSNLMQLNNAEKDWLKQHKNIRFVGNPNWLPLEAFDSQGNHIGITAEHLSLIEQKLGITLQKIPTKTWQESIEKIKAGEADILSESTSSELKSFLSFTQPYVSSPIVIVMKNNHNYIENIEQIKDKKIALIKDYAYADKIIEQYPNIKFKFVSNIQEGLTDVSVGKVDALFATLSQSSYHISKLGINNVLIVGKTEFVSQQAFSIRSELAPLIPLFNRAINTISQSEKQSIYNNWGKSQFAVKTNYQLLFQIAAILALIIIIFIYWNRKLAKEINLRVQIERQTQSIIDAIPIQIIITSQEGKIISANPKALNDYNIKKHDITQYNITQFYADMADRDAVFNELSSKGKVEQKLVKFKRLNQELRSMMVSIMPVMFNDKQAYLSIAVDLTDRLNMEDALHSAKESAEQANKAKSLFLANMSHEIRTPMNAIIGFTELLNDQIQDSKLKKYTKIIQSAGNNLLTLINDILDLSKIESGRYEIIKTAVNPHELFAEIGNIFLIKMQENNIEFNIDIDPKIPNSLLLDATRIRQVIFNLLGNAVKFTKNGYIKVLVKSKNLNDILSTVDLEISIQDSGIGIAEDQLESIFEAFEQAKGQDSSQYGGTGLGLPISKRLVAMMGGELSVRSDSNIGSTFNIRLNQVDVASVKPEDIHSHPRESIKYDFKAAHILIVDDVADNRALIIENLSMFPALIIKEAINGEEAVKICRDNEFDLILMDIRMPVMDGYQATHQIRQFSKTPIIALTASVVIGEFSPLQQDDFDGYLRKPVLKKDLFYELSKYLPYDEMTQIKPLKEDVSVNTKELQYLAESIKGIKSLQEQCLRIMQSNDISSIEQFANNVLSINEQYPVKAVHTYATKLLENIESYDIANIKNSLENYSTLINKLESIAKKATSTTK